MGYDRPTAWGTVPSRPRCPMSYDDVLARYFAAKATRGGIALSAMDASLTKGFSTARIAKVEDRRIYFTIGETAAGRSQGLSRRIRQTLASEGLTVVTEATSGDRPAS